jgi:hypothetical protein
MVAVVVFEKLAALEELSVNLLLLGVKFERNCVECRDGHCAFEGRNNVAARDVAKLVTVPVNLLAVEAIDRTILRVVVVGSLRELGTAVSTEFLGVNSRTRLEDGPQVAESDHLVLDEVILCFNSVLQFRLEGCVQQLEVVLSLSLFLLFESRGKLGPAMDKWIEGSLKSKSLEGGSDPLDCVRLFNIC